MFFDLCGIANLKQFLVTVTIRLFKQETLLVYIRNQILIIFNHVLKFHVFVGFYKNVSGKKGYEIFKVVSVSYILDVEYDILVYLLISNMNM